MAELRGHGEWTNRRSFQFVNRFSALHRVLVIVAGPVSVVLGTRLPLFAHLVHSFAVAIGRFLSCLCLGGIRGRKRCCVCVLRAGDGGETGGCQSDKY